MSHFYTFVLVDPGEGQCPGMPALELAVGELLAPFDENQSVESYRVYPDAENISRMIAAHAKSVGGDPVNTGDPHAVAALMPWWRGTDGFVDDEGRVYYESSYNPDSKWDWWCVGGRYSGRILEKVAERGRQGEYERGTAASAIAVTGDASGNAWPVRFLPDLRKREGDSVWGLPFAILTPTGEWLEKGKVGWFGMSDDTHTQEQWEVKVLETLSAYPTAIAVIVDCHI